MTATAVSSTVAPPVYYATLEAVGADVATARLPDGSALPLPRSEYFSEHRWTVGERVLVVPDPTFRFVSAISPQIPQALFDGFVPELRNGIVTVMGVARVAGSRTKVAVASADPNLEAVAACIGRGAGRVKAVVSLLGGERVDLVAWHEDLADYAISALQPARVDRIEIAPNNTAIAYCPAHMMAAAVGEGGLNTRLASDLTGLTITVEPT